VLLSSNQLYQQKKQESKEGFDINLLINGRICSAYLLNHNTRMILMHKQSRLNHQTSVVKNIEKKNK
jgi:hypothetical protein